MASTCYLFAIGFELLMLRRMDVAREDQPVCHSTALCKDQRAAMISFDVGSFCTKIRSCCGLPMPSSNQATLDYTLISQPCGHRRREPCSQTG